MQPSESADTHRRSRQAILDRLQTRSVDAPDLPTIDERQLVQFEDPIATFIDRLEFVGGQAHRIKEASEARAILEEIEVFAAANQICSLVPEIYEGNFDAAAIEDPHDLSTLDWVIAPGEFPVAENGAIWIDGTRLPHRVLLFIPQYLAIVVSESKVVHHMHQAYETIGRPPRGFGIFVSGPSKTADIEQSLVLGAHGCRKLQVFLTT